MDVLKKNYDKFKSLLEKSEIPVEDDRLQEQHANENDGVLETPIALLSIQSAQWQYMTSKRRGVLDFQVRVFDTTLESVMSLHDTVLDCIGTSIVEATSSFLFDTQNGFWVTVINIKLPAQ
jgi:hypothetical protein